MTLPTGLAGYVQGEHDHALEVASKIRAGQITINKGARVRWRHLEDIKPQEMGESMVLTGLKNA